MRAVKAVGEGVVAVRYVRGSDEARIFAEHLHGLIMDAGWLRNGRPMLLDRGPRLQRSRTDRRRNVPYVSWISCAVARTLVTRLSHHRH